ncbi:MAG: low molecular weight protein-tyrosine-phosphatase [Halieaceae bacterium]|jgi:protein-tyrosine phosphatase
MTARVLFVCMGNICRSPTAHAVFRQQVLKAGLSDQIEIDSAGTHGYHIGNPPDARATATARQRGIEMSDLSARQVAGADFTHFDYIVAMDNDNMRLLKASCPQGEQQRLSLMLDWATGWGDEVPDPYYGGDSGFEHVFDMLTDACGGLLAAISSRHGLTAQPVG